MRDVVVAGAGHGGQTLLAGLAQSEGEHGCKAQLLTVRGGGRRLRERISILSGRKTFRKKPTGQIEDLTLSPDRFDALGSDAGRRALRGAGVSLPDIPATKQHTRRILMSLNDLGVRISPAQGYLPLLHTIRAGANEVGGLISRPNGNPAGSLHI